MAVFSILESPSQTPKVHVHTAFPLFRQTIHWTQSFFYPTASSQFVAHLSMVFTLGST